MSYFFDAFDDFYIKNRAVLPDGSGGTRVEWTNGAVVKMSLDLGDASEIRQAEAQGLKSVFTANFPIDTPVKYDDYLENVKTGAIYRITGNPQDNKTPETARFQSCFATAVRTELPR